MLGFSMQIRPCHLPFGRHTRGDRRRIGRLTLGFVTSLLAAALFFAGYGKAQTLARPGWAGSGIKIAQWWRSSVIVEVSPESAGEGAVLNHTRLQLGDLQTLGTDVILLRGIDADAPASVNHAEPQLAAGYGTIDEFDQLMREASGRRMRLMVELPSTLSENALLADARFWLNRGVSGIFLQGEKGSSAEAVRGLRGVLRSYVGDRVLAGEVSGEDVLSSRGAADGPDMIFSTLQGFGSGLKATDVAAVRASIGASAGVSRKGSEAGVSAISPTAPPVSGEEARARATALLLVRGSVALRAQDVGLGPEGEARLQQSQRQAVEKKAIDAATSPAGVSNARRAAATREASAPTALELPGDATFVWYQKMIGLHRGNASLLGEEQTFLNEDDTGTLVAVWQSRSGQPLVAVVNLHGEPCKLNLTEDFAKLHLRGLFLRTVVRTDAGMGAMPLGAVRLPGYGVYIGQLGR